MEMEPVRGTGITLSTGFLVAIFRQRPQRGQCPVYVGHGKFPYVHPSPPPLGQPARLEAQPADRDSFDKFCKLNSMMIFDIMMASLMIEYHTDETAIEDEEGLKSVDRPVQP